MLINARVLCGRRPKEKYTELTIDLSLNKLCKPVSVLVHICNLSPDSGSARHWHAAEQNSGVTEAEK